MARKLFIPGPIDVMPDVLEKMGAKITWGEDFIQAERAELHGIDMDMNHIPIQKVRYYCPRRPVRA